MSDVYLKINNLSFSHQEPKKSSGEKSLNLNQPNLENCTLRQLDMEVEQGDIVCIVGPSGCGKTTLLRSIAGFEVPGDGSIFLDRTEIFGKKVNLAPEKREMGFVFQDLVLFPHLSAGDNIGFGLLGLDKKSKRARITELLALIGLTGYENRFPHELSGGQKQRIALARALAPYPKLLLLDEPFSSLDEDLAEAMSEELRKLLKIVGITAIIVTHNQNEAYLLGDKIAVMFDGKVQGLESPEQLYKAPPSRQIAQFLGDGSFLTGEVVLGQNGRPQIKTELGEINENQLLASASATLQSFLGSTVDVFIRPEQIKMLDPTDHTEQTVARVNLKNRVFKGTHYLLEGELESGQRLRLLSKEAVSMEEVSVRAVLRKCTYFSYFGRESG